MTTEVMGCLFPAWRRTDSKIVSAWGQVGLSPEVVAGIIE